MPYLIGYPLFLLREIIPMGLMILYSAIHFLPYTQPREHPSESNESHEDGLCCISLPVYVSSHMNQRIDPGRIWGLLKGRGYGLLILGRTVVTRSRDAPAMAPIPNQVTRRLGRNTLDSAVHSNYMIDSRYMR